MNKTTARMPQFVVEEQKVEFIVGQNTYQIVKTNQNFSFPSSVRQPVLPVAFKSVPFCGTAIVKGTSTDWAFMPLDDDPLNRPSALLRNHKYPVPRSVLKQLKEIAATGVEFDILYVAHEMERGAQPTWDSLCPPLHPSVERKWVLLTPPSVKLATSIAKAMVETVWTRHLQACKAIVTENQRRVVQRQLDPILFGVNIDSRGMASWHVLAEWVW